MRVHRKDENSKKQTQGLVTGRVFGVEGTMNCGGMTRTYLERANGRKDLF